ncbi:ABC transporter ATP-binding protein [Cumulibacter soli]|uniref:ABC transporter ATP-binding protein n=1 Tax=Cumulibacter soli TaxID=2546344 RepID=UPI001068BE7A|nr:ABC transporter ATP-binding protein [Cumulibacter soli]
MLQVTDLEAVYTPGSSRLPVIRGIDITIETGSALAVVGESGSGKSTLALAVMRMIEAPIGEITGGSIKLSGVELRDLTIDEMRDVLHRKIGYIPQDPTTALDPLFTVRTQIAEAMSGDMSRRAVDDQIVQLLEDLGVSPAVERLRNYPHEFSGGMRQRVAMAIALAKDPELLIADEPTTALDVTTQLATLRIINRLRSELNLTTLFITHDLRVARLLCERVAVMYAGQVVETGVTRDVMAAPAHPYTRALLDSTGAGAQPLSPLKSIPGQPPSPGQIAQGCAFAPRCPLADARCRTQMPEPRDTGGSTARCWKPLTGIEDA